MARAATNKLKVGILGASGYTGADLVRLLAGHPSAEIAIVTGNTQAGKRMADVFPHLGALDLPPLIATEDADWSGIDVALCGLPHGTTQKVIAGLPKALKVIDLSADFRLKDPAAYREWYGHPHAAVALQADAVYGLSEHNREAVAAARLVACPGCYPTAALLPLLPLVEAGLIDADDIVIDAKSGASGAGRAVKQETLFTEVSEGLHPYNIARHRHAPEMEQELSRAAGRALLISFTPHLVPMNRGEIATTYVRLASGRTAAELRAALAARYRAEPFVRVLGEGAVPHSRHVRGSNYCLIGVFADRIPGRAILVSAIDNLVKGASGQAIQNMNIMFGLPETLGLLQQPLFP
jgi:N-acetyl-gamma-glutamyl-phosphate reductase